MLSRISAFDVHNKARRNKHGVASFRYTFRCIPIDSADAQANVRLWATKIIRRQAGDRCRVPFPVSLPSRFIMANPKENPQLNPVLPSPAEGRKAKPGAAWKDGETHVLPHNNLPVVFGAFMCCVFLAALDQVSLPLAQLNLPHLD